MKRDLLSLNDLTGDEMDGLFDLADDLKKGKNRANNALKGQSIALVFQKPSNRTRVSFEVGIVQLGGNCIYLGPSEINLGIRESIADVSKTLSRYLDGIVTRTNTHQDLLEFAKHASIPIINGLSDLDHPCQALADILSIREKFGKTKGLTLAFIGDGNNVCHSLLLGCAKTGINMRVATPKGYGPNPTIVASARLSAQKTNTHITISRSPSEAVKDADVIYSDVWVSMGQEGESKQRLKDFSRYQINAALTKYAAKNYIFMHCLPAHRGQEMTAEIIDGKHSIVFDQAENRLHIQKAILVTLIGKTRQRRL